MALAIGKKKVVDDAAVSSPTMKFLGKGKPTVAEALDDGGTLGEEQVQIQKPLKEKKAKVVAPKTLAPEVDVNDLMEMTKLEIAGLTEETAFGVAHDLIDQTGMNDFKLGGVLSAIQIHGWWEGKSFENFRTFVEAEFGLAYRKSMYLITIYNYLSESGVPYEAVKHLGWTKLRELAGVLTLENMDEWIERAQDMTVIQLVDYIKASATVVDPDGETKVMTSATELTTLTFKVHDDQKEVIKEAVEKAKKDFNTEFDSVAMENIAMSFIEGTTGKKVAANLVASLAALGLEQAIATFESAFPGASLSLELPPD
jgi:hypothetical protein